MAESESSTQQPELFIERHLFQEMVAHLEAELPNEGCGFLAGTSNRVLRGYAVENLLKSPTAFEMNPQQQLEALLDIEQREIEVLAIYHSHPNGPEYPSQEDISKAYYPDTLIVIVSFAMNSSPSVRSFIINGVNVSEGKLTIGDNFRSSQ
ncbi:MAG: M67 family metallopeptidase [Candidatus Promineifilaceae bacterium]|jgi:proteasome lid subunit RPN8/RPN11